MIGLLVVIVFIVYLANNLLDDVLHGNNARGAAKFVHHNGNVNLVLLEVAQKVVNHLGFGHKVWRTYQRLPAERRFLQVRQKVLDVEHALYVVGRTLIHWYAAVVVLHNALYHVLEGSVYVQVHDVHTWSHHLAHRFAAKTDYALQHLALFCNILLVGKFHCLLQVFNSKRLCLKGNNSVGKGLAHHQHG